MGEHVVHLGGDTGALRGPRRLLAQFPLDSQVRDLAVQRLDQAAATAGCSGKRSESRPSRTCAELKYVRWAQALAALEAAE
jgi:hypothetical protein